MPPPAGAKVRVVVVEDSQVQQAHLVDVLEADGDVDVVAVAASAPEAIEVIARTRPDVVTLDLQIPGGGGQWVIGQVMAVTPTPILVLSASVDDHRSVPAIEALVGGALVALPKPARWTSRDEAQIRRTVRSLCKVVVVRHPRGASTGACSSPPSAPIAGPRRGAVVALAASAGGPPALAKVLGSLGGLPAPVLVVQHIHADFVAGLVEWLRRESALPVGLAEHGDTAQAGRVYVGPAGMHLRLDGRRRIELDANPVTVHRPAANELFASLARNVGAEGVGVILTGMGDDGARGLLALRRRGGYTVAQDEGTSAVFGMPKAADNAGAVTDLLPLADIGAAVLRAIARLHA
jgi:two-component system, chemotaxis family, protein-glutamate methylesterase/glutaminase